MTSIGNSLKEARTKKSITLEEVHSKIKIHPRVLQFLEEEKFDKLPGPLFVKSFLKMYSEFLGINPDEIIQIYEQEKRKDPEQILFIRPAGEKESMRLGDFGVKFRSLAAGLLVVSAVLALVFFVRPGGKKVLKTPVSQPVRSDEWARSVSLGNFPSLEKNKQLKLEIKAVDNVWLRVTCDGKVLFQSVLKRGVSESWAATRQVEIWTGNSSNMALFINGYSLGSPGRGVVKKMIITHDGLKILS